MKEIGAVVSNRQQYHLKYEHGKHGVMHDLRSFTIETFAPLVGETFRIHSAGAPPVEVELISAEPYGGQAAGGRAPFSIVFRSSSQRVLAQMTYRVEHAVLGTFDLFMVPIGPDEAGMRYEAVFA